MMDEMDQKWVETFVGEEDQSIPAGALIQGFISVISWIDEDGNFRWRLYNTLDLTLSNILGLLEMAKYTMMVDNTIRKED